MRKVHLLLIGMLAMSSTLVAAMPQGHVSASPALLTPAAVTASASTTTAPATAPVTLAELFSPAVPSASQACNLLCIQGYHCCIIKKQATCIPNDQPCP
jgi:hypothetical protein